MTRPLLLQLFPFSDFLENELSQRFKVVRWFQLKDPAEMAPADSFQFPRWFLMFD
jgi:hypothetical protein